MWGRSLYLSQVVESNWVIGVYSPFLSFFLPPHPPPDLTQGEEQALLRQMFKVVADWRVGRRRRKRKSQAVMLGEKREEEFLLLLTSL